MFNTDCVAVNDTCNDITQIQTHKERTLHAKHGTLSLGSFSERIDFDLSGVDFHEQIIEPLNLICRLRGTYNTVIITSRFGPTKAAQPPAQDA